MALLLLVSFIWAFSFGLIGSALQGVDAALVSTARLGLALLVFLPFLRPFRLPWRTCLALLAIGGLQFGVMYLLYIQSFRYLQAHEAALFTLTTPIIVTLAADLFAKRVRWVALAAAALAVIGAVPVTRGVSDLSLTLTGILLVQGSNAAFGVGQVLYTRLRSGAAWHDRDGFGLMYAGGVLVALTLLLTRNVSANLTSTHLWTLLYLGVLASGIGFFLWNRGATQVSAGTLAVMNNAKVPLGVACSLLFFGGSANLLWLTISLGVMSFAVWLAQRAPGEQR